MLQNNHYEIFTLQICIILYEQQQLNIQYATFWMNKKQSKFKNNQSEDQDNQASEDVPWTNGQSILNEKINPLNAKAQVPLDQVEPESQHIIPQEDQSQEVQPRQFKKKIIKLSKEQYKKKHKATLGSPQETKNLAVCFCHAVQESTNILLSEQQKEIFRNHIKFVKNLNGPKSGVAIVQFNELFGLTPTKSVEDNEQFFKKRLPEVFKQMVDSGLLFRKLMTGSAKKKISTKLISLKRFNKIVSCLINGKELTQWK